MRVLEFGQSFSVAYAGMVLAEQGHQVTRWTNPSAPDIVESFFRSGPELWAWLTEGKVLVPKAAAEVAGMTPGLFDVIIDNFTPAAWQRWDVDPASQAKRLNVTWVSIRDDFGDWSFDAIAQARAWGDHLGYIPAYLGDTVAGLWAAFKALAAPPGHHVIGQAVCLAKMIEGELVVPPPRPRDGKTIVFEPDDDYGPDGDGVTVTYRGQKKHEPFRDDRWRRENLPNVNGRFTV
jgi:hypothetical protein